jgi:hypothetical protein
MALIKFYDFVYYVVFASEVTVYDIMSDFLNKRSGEAGVYVKIEDDSDDDENITFMEASNMMRCHWRFVMSKKDILECVLDSIEIL